MSERTEDAQTTALRAFLLLCSVAESWQGSLVLRAGLDEKGTGVARAALIAGAVCLAIDSRADLCRSALHSGACDFAVNTVDEALRILKNEVRKRHPVSVALMMQEHAALAELAGRGVAPGLVSCPVLSEADAAIGAFAGFGSRSVDDTAAAGLVNEFARAQGLTLHEFHFATMQELAAFDRRLAAATPRSGLRSRWVAGAPSLFYRERPFRRVAFLTAAERAATDNSGFRELTS